MEKGKQNMVCRTNRQGILTIVHGAAVIDIPDYGLSVGELRWSYRDVLNVGSGARPYVGGVLADEDYVPLPLACVEYMRDWGRKGAGRPNLVLVEFGPQTRATLERLAMAAEQIVTSLNLPANNHPALTGEIGWIATEGKTPQSSPYLSADKAAGYLGVSVKSLYGIVERRHLVPLRGPRRAYRFTVEMLDEYLKRR